MVQWRRATCVSHANESRAVHGPQALGPGEEAPDDPPPMVVPGQCDELVLPVPPKPSSLAPQDKVIAVQSLGGGPLVCVQRIDTRPNLHAAWVPMAALGTPPTQYEALYPESEPASGKLRIHFDMPDKDADAVDITWRLEPDYAAHAMDWENDEPAAVGMQLPLVLLAMVWRCMHSYRGFRAYGTR